MLSISKYYAGQLAGLEHKGLITKGEVNDKGTIQCGAASMMGVQKVKDKGQCKDMGTIRYGCSLRHRCESLGSCRLSGAVSGLGVSVKGYVSSVRPWHGWVKAQGYMLKWKSCLMQKRWNCRQLSPRSFGTACLGLKKECRPTRVSCIIFDTELMSTSRQKSPLVLNSVLFVLTASKGQVSRLTWVRDTRMGTRHSYGV